MTKQLSFTKQENEILPDFRQKLNLAESSEDVKKFFVYTIKHLLESIASDKISCMYEDVALRKDREPYFKLSPRLLASREFKAVWEGSDLPHVLSRLAKSAVNRYNRLEKHAEKTDSKIRM